MASRLAGPLACVLANEVFAARRLEEALARLANSELMRMAPMTQGSIAPLSAYPLLPQHRLPPISSVSAQARAAFKCHPTDFRALRGSAYKNGEEEPPANMHEAH